MRWLSLTLIVFAAAVAVAAFAPNVGLWGLDHLALYPIPVRIIALVLVALSFVPPIARRAYSSATRAFSAARSPGAAAAWSIAIAVAAFSIFWALHSSTNLLGDGRIIEEAFDRAGATATEEVSTTEFATHVDTRAAGATLLFYFAVKAGDRIAGISPMTSIRIVACLLGAVLVAVVLGVAFRTSLPPDLGLWLLILVFTSGAMQLFFGYVEFYAPTLVLAVLYVLAALRTLHTRGRPWIPALLVLLAAFCHMQALLLGPSLLFVFVWYFARRKRESIQRPAALAILVLFAVGTLALAFFTPLREHFLPLSSTRYANGLFSLAHTRDVASALVLLMPTLPVVVVMAIVSRRWPVPDPSRAWAVGASFLSLLLIPAMAYLVTFKPDIGAARDWDLFAITTVGLVPVAFGIVRRIHAAKIGLAWMRLHTLPVLVTSAVLTTTWVGINAGSNRSVSRFLRTLEFDRSGEGYAYETLAKHYLDEGRKSEALEAMSTAAGSGNPRQVLNLAVMYRRKGEIDKAVDVLERFVRTHPDNKPVRRAFLTYLYGARRLEDAVEEARDAVERDPQEAFYYYLLGKALYQLGRTGEAAEALATCKRLGPAEATAADADAILQRIRANE